MNIETYHKSKSKIKNPTDDFEKGEEDREIWTAVINNIIGPYGMKLVRIHSFLRRMSGSEKRTNNTLVNRIIEVGMLSAMGLDYLLQGEWTSKQVIISLRRSTDPDLFYKLPKEAGFVESVLTKTHFIFLNHPHLTEYVSISGSEMDWRHYSNSTNKNRIYALEKRIHRPIRPKNLTYRDLQKTTKPSRSCLIATELLSLPEYFKEVLK